MITIEYLNLINKVFEYNQHFVAMMNIINAARLNPPESGHKHHIIPKCWFRKNNLPIDNSKDNLVLLTKEQHMKVHKLAAMCIIGSNMRTAMAYATHMLHGTFTGMHCSEYTRRKISDTLKGRRLSEETRLKMSEAKKGKSFTEEHRRKLSESHKGITHSEESRHKMSELAKGKVMSAEARRKMSESRKGKPKTEFGKKFKEHYDMTSCDNHKLYSKEYMYYITHDKCRWE